MNLVRSAVVAAVALTLELLLPKQLQDSGAWVATHLQHEDWPVLNALATEFGEISGYIFIVLSGSLYLSMDRLVGLSALTATYLSLALAGTLKMLIAHPRPYWAYPEVIAFDCPSDFGAPSGHSTRVGATVFVLWHFWSCNGKLRRVKALVAGACLGLVVLDRVYLGVHFYFQTVLGLAVGNLSAAIVVDPYCQTWLKSVQGNPGKLKGALVCAAAGFGVAAGVYAGWNPSWEASWTQTVLDKCGNLIDSTASLQKGIIQNDALWMLAGCLIGFSLLSKRQAPHFSLKNFCLAFVLMFIVVQYSSIVGKIIFQADPRFFSVILVGINQLACGVILTVILPHLLRGPEPPIDDLYKPLTK